MAKRLWEVIRRKQFDRYTQFLLDLALRFDQIEQGRIGRGIHQQVEIAPLEVYAAQHGAEHAYIGRSMPGDNRVYYFTFRLQNFGWT